MFWLLDFVYSGKLWGQTRMNVQPRACAHENARGIRQFYNTTGAAGIAPYPELTPKRPESRASPGEYAYPNKARTNK
jgi:hypothetical protein